MTTIVDESIEDVQEAVRAGRVPRPHGPYRVQFGNERLEYRPGIIADPVPTARQLLDAADARPPDDYLIYRVLKNGLLEEFQQLEETTDLRARGIEKFLVLRSDRSFRFDLDGRRFEWGSMLISGMTLKKLAEVDPETYGVWLEVRGGDDKAIGNDELIDLSAPGVEHFFTGIVKTTEG